ncbi:38192_t:CDS:2, partial [Gigaspora margarita]
MTMLKLIASTVLMKKTSLDKVAADWYKEVRSKISCWKTKSENEVKKNKSFYHLLVEQFMPLEKQHYWQIELNSLTQQEHERVDTYTTKFKKLLNCVNTNNCLSDAYIVRIFLGGLKAMNAALVAIVVPKSLIEAIAAARRMKTGNYYSQHNAKVAKQVRVESKLSDFKKRINEIALNYAILMGKIKIIKEHLQTNKPVNMGNPKDNYSNLANMNDLINNYDKPNNHNEPDKIDNIIYSHK